VFVCLFALMIVLLIYCVLSIVVILINIILVMCDVDYYYFRIRFMLPPCILNVTLDLIYCLRVIAASLL